MTDGADGQAIKKMKILRKRRVLAKGTCTRTAAYVRNIDTNLVTEFELKQRKDKLESCWELFNSAQEEIEMIEDSEDHGDAQEKERTDFEEEYFSVLGKFDELIAIKTAQSALPTEQLPRLDLLSFSGTFNEWYPFRDVFESLIHWNASLCNIQKFYYLKAALRNEAAAVVHSLEISDANYNQAWNMLIERFDNKRIIVQTHVKAIFELSPVHKESHAALRNLLDGVTKHLGALKALHRPTDAWDDILIHIIFTKLDSVSRREWETSITGSEMPTLKQLMDFLSQRTQTLEDRSKSAQGAQETFTKCPICSGNHYICQCAKFIKASMDVRMDKVRANKLCMNCLRTTSHEAKACGSGVCKKCGQKHSTLLHTESPHPAVEATNSTSSQQNPEESNQSTLPHSEETHASREATTSTSSKQNPKKEIRSTLLHPLIARKLEAGEVFYARVLVEIWDRRARLLKMCYSCFNRDSKLNIIKLSLVRILGLQESMGPLSEKEKAIFYSHVLDHPIGMVKLPVRSLINGKVVELKCFVTKTLRTVGPSISEKCVPVLMEKFYASAMAADTPMLPYFLHIGAEAYWEVFHKS